MNYREEYAKWLDGDLFDEETVRELKNLKDTKGETDEYKATVECVTKLMDRSIEIKKLTFDQTNKLSRQVIDDKAKVKQDEEDRKDRLIKNCISVAGIVIPALITIWGTLKSLKFEQDGTVTSMAGRAFVSRLFPKK